MTEFDDVIRLLEDGRPEATDLELDQIKQRVRRRSADPSRRSQSMKSRVAILGMLVTGILFSTAGAGLALSGVQSQHNASVSQYAVSSPTPVCTMTPTPTPGGTSPASTPSGNSEVCSEGGILPAEDTKTPTHTTIPASTTSPASTPTGS